MGECGDDIMMNVSLTTDPKVLVGIYDFMRNTHGLVAETEEDAQAIMMTYIELFIDEYGLDTALTDGLLVPTETM